MTSIASYADLDSCFRRDTDQPTHLDADEIRATLLDHYAGLSLRERARWLDDQPPQVRELIDAAVTAETTVVLAGVDATAAMALTARKRVA